MSNHAWFRMENANEPVQYCATAKKDAYFLRKNGTGEGTRTPTPLREADFESAASTNSATPAPRGRTLVGKRRRVNKFVWAKTNKRH